MRRVEELAIRTARAMVAAFPEWQMTAQGHLIHEGRVEYPVPKTPGELTDALRWMQSKPLCGKTDADCEALGYYQHVLDKYHDQCPA